MLIDSHCHIHDQDTYRFAFSRAQISHKMLAKYPDMPHELADFTPDKLIERAHDNDVMKMICIGTSHQDSLLARDFATEHVNNGVYWSYGIHPDEADSEITASGSCRHGFPHCSSLTTLRGNGEPLHGATPRSEIPVAIGEVGLDYHGKSIAENGADFREQQIQLFEQMLQLARDNDLPLIFHVREAYDDFFAVLKNFPGVRGVVHSFSDSEKNLRESLDRGFYIGVNGMATFAPELPLPPLERMLLETDAPFLTPAPFRGTINEPAYIKNICAYISKVKGESEQTVAKITTKNAEKLFNI
ncbi:TatD family hydrolase [Candidatus Saccharibacteria bacterium]|nr:TatD family hydrolase [Candidatus Saccharibacteria bacterium]